MRKRVRRMVGAGCCCAALGVVALTGFSASSSAATACRPFSVGYQELYSVLPLTVANATGILKKNKLCTPTLVPFTSLPAMIAAVSQNQVTTALQTPSLIVNYNKATSNSPMQFFAPGQNFNFIWTGKKGSGIPPATAKNWKSTILAFKGKVIGVPAIGGLGDLVLRYMAKQVGLVPNSDFQIVVTGTGPTEIAALQAGSAAVVSGDAFGATSLTVPGIGVNVLNMGIGQGPPAFKGTFESGYFAPTSTIAGNVALYRAIAKSISQAQAYMKKPANKKTMTAIIAADIGTQSDVAAALYQSRATFQDKLSPKAWAATGVAFVRAGLFPPPAPAYSSVIATNVVGHF